MDLKVKIITEAELGALQGVSKEFKSASESAKFFTDTLKQQEEQAARSNASITAESSTVKKSAKDSATAFEELLGPVKKSTDAITEAQKPVEKLVVSKRTLKSALKELSHAFPEAGSAMLLLKNPITILVGALATAVVAVRSYLVSVNELAKAADIHEAVSRSMLTIGGAARDAATGLKQFRQDMDDAATSGGKLVSKMGEVETAIQKAGLRETEKRDAREALAVAKVNAAEKDGAISPQQAIQQRLNVTNTFAAERAAAKKREEDELIEARGEDLRRMQESRIKAETLLPKAKLQAAQDQRLLDTAPDKLKSDLEDLDTRADEARKRKAGALARRGGFQAGLLDTVAGIAPKGSNAGAGAGAFRERQDEIIDSADAELRQIEEQRAKVSRQPGLAAQRAEKSTKRAGELESLINSARDAEGGLFNDIVSGKQRNDSDQQTREQAGAMQGEARSVSARADMADLDRKDAARMEGEIAKAYKEIADSFDKYHGVNVEGVLRLQVKIDTLTKTLQQMESRRGGN